MFFSWSVISICFHSDLLCFAEKSKAQKIWKLRAGTVTLFCPLYDLGEFPYWLWSKSTLFGILFSEEGRTGKHLVGHVSSILRISYHLIRLSSTEVLQEVWHSAWEKSVFSFTNAECSHFRQKFTNHCFYLVQKWSKMYLSLENKYNPLKLTILWFSLETLITLGILLIILYTHFGTNVDSILCINSSYFQHFTKSFTLILLHDQNIFSSSFWCTRYRALEQSSPLLKFLTFLPDFHTKLTFLICPSMFHVCFIFLACVFSLIPSHFSLSESQLFPSISHVLSIHLQFLS